MTSLRSQTSLRLPWNRSTQSAKGSRRRLCYLRQNRRPEEFAATLCFTHENSYCQKENPFPQYHFFAIDQFMKPRTGISCKNRTAEGGIPAIGTNSSQIFAGRILTCRLANPAQSFSRDPLHRHLLCLPSRSERTRLAYQLNTLLSVLVGKSAVMSQYERIANFEVSLKLRDIRRRRIRNLTTVLSVLVCASILGCL